MKKNIKIVSAIMAIVMMLSFAGCSSKNDSKSNENPAEEKSHTTEVEDSDEPNTPSDIGVDVDIESTTADNAPDGKYTYTLYGKTITMDVNIEDYLGVNSVGTKVFYLPRLVFDLGWYAGEYKSMDEMGSNNFPKRWWYYSDNDLATYIDAGTRLESGQFNYIAVNYIVSGSLPFEAYYDDGLKTHLPYSCLILDHTNDCEYVAAGGLGSMSYEDIVLVTFILWAEAENPGSNAMIATFGEDFSYITASSSYVGYTIP